MIFFICSELSHDKKIKTIKFDNFDIPHFINKNNKKSIFLVNLKDLMKNYDCNKGRKLLNIRFLGRLQQLDKKRMLSHHNSSPTLRQYLSKLSKLKRAKSNKGQVSALGNDGDDDFDIYCSKQTLLNSFEKLKTIMLDLGRQSPQYNRLVGLISDFEHILKRLTEKLNPLEENKNNNLLHPNYNVPRSPKMKSKSPPTLKFEPMLTVQLKSVKEENPHSFLDSTIKSPTSQKKIQDVQIENDNYFLQSTVRPAIFQKEKSSLLSTKSKDINEQNYESQLNPSVQVKKAALKLNLENISSKRFFKGKIQRMDSIGSAQIESNMRGTLKVPPKI